MDFQKIIKFNSEKSIKKALLHILIYLIFLVMATVVAVAARHHYLYYFNHAIKHHFLIYEHQMTNYDWWTELTEVYVPEVLQPSKADEENPSEEKEDDENKDSENKENESENEKPKQAKDELTILHENILLGTPRLRQLRVEKEDCVVTGNFMESFGRACYPMYSVWNQRTEGEHQGSKYKTAYNLSTMPISGRMHTYWGGGFVENLYRDLDRSVASIKMLEKRLWLDRGTRLMVFEFTLYNNNTDLFNNIKILGEVPVTGGVIIYLQVKAIQKYAVWTGSVWIILAAILFYIMVVYYIVVEVRVLLKREWKTYINFWKLVDLVILILAIFSFIYNIFHPIYLHYYLKDALAKESEYHSLDFICWFNKHYMNLMAVLAFLVWIKIFQLFNFNKTTLQLRATFLMCYKDLLNFVLIFLILFFSYAILGMLLFGHAHADFYIFPIAFWSVMRMLLADFDYTGVERANRVFAPIYFLSFILIVCFILINMFLAVIYDTFRDIKNVQNPPEDNQLPQFFGKYWDKGKSSGMKALNKMGLYKPTQSATGSQPLREVGSDLEPPFPPTAKSVKKIKVPKSELLKNFFEIVHNKRDAEQTDRLAQHISLLEDILAKMSDDIKRLEAESPDPSTRPERPAFARVPPRLKAFVNKYK